MTKGKQQALNKVSVMLDTDVAGLIKQLRDAGINPNEALRKELHKASKSLKKTAKNIGEIFLAKGEGQSFPSPAKKGKCK